MSQDFRSRYSEMRENDLTGPDDSGAASDQYPSHSNTRNLGFVWPDGRKLFLNYAYLVSCEYLPDESSITLAFTTHVVTLKGIRLESLFDELMGHVPRMIASTDARYNVTSEDQTLINAIDVLKL